MIEQLKLLDELQRHDARLQEVDAALKALPEKVEALKKDLGRVDAMLTQERQSLAETEKFRRDLDGQLKADESNIVKAKAKLSQVKTGKDYMAAQREMEATRKLVGEREEEILRLLAAIEASKKSIAAHEKDVADLRAVVEREDQSTTAKIKELTDKSAGARAEREAIAKQVRPDLLKRYNAIRARRGIAVVPVTTSACQGCHMAIPPQLYNTLRSTLGTDVCPSCHRIIYAAEALEAPQSK